MDRRGFLASSAASIVAAHEAVLGSRQPLRGWSVLGQHPQRARPIPTAAQLAWQRDELALFLHFGVNTFTDREWGDGKEDPAIFNPGSLDAAQWARTAKAGGCKAIILTAKHHDGFCLWPSATTTHSVASSPWRGGKGDVVREFVDACRAEGLRPGLYLSPWDRNHPTYGDSPRYMDVYIQQLTELCTQYGELAEVWFDGANGEGPNGKKQVYDWRRIWGKVRELQPNAVIFSDAGPDVRWCGNERGTAGDPNWSTVNPAAVPYPGADGPGIIASLQHGDPDGTVWRPAEVDVSIRPGWFYHPAEDNRVRSVPNLEELYLSSVGRNGKLLLNVPPTRDGLLHDADVRALRQLRSQLQGNFRWPAEVARQELTTGNRSARLELEFAKLSGIAWVRLGEDIANGQIVSKHTVSALEGGTWKTVSQGSTIGYARIVGFPRMSATRLRVDIETVDTPAPISAVAYWIDV